MPANERTPLLSDAQQMAQSVKPDLLHVAKIIGALQAGKLPTQSQVNRAIDALTSKTSVLSPDRRKGEGKLSENGRLILEDTRDILQKLKVWLDSKNKGDVLQEIFYHAQRAELDVDADGGIDVHAPASTSEVKKDANDFSETIRTLARLVLDQAKVLKKEASENANDLSGDLVLLARDLLADAAEEVAAVADNAAKEIRPEDGEDGKVSKEDLKKKGKEVQNGAKAKAEKTKARLEKESGPAQEKATEAKDKAVDRLLQVVQRIQKDPAYKKAFEQLYGLARKYYKKTGEAIEATAESVDVDGDVYGNEHSQKVVESFKQLLENLANGRSVDPLLETAKKVFDDIKNDDRLTEYFEDLEKFVRKVLEDPDYAMSKQPKEEAGKLQERGQALLKENADWKKDSDALLKELEGFANDIKDDKESKDLAEAFKKLGQDTAKTAKVGASMFRGQAGAFYRDIFNVVVPRALALLQEIPIPRTEYKSDDLEFVVDNFTISSASFVPDNLRVTHFSDFNASRIGKANGKVDLDSHTRVRFDGLRFAAKDVSFWVRRPGAILLSEERGLLDFSLSGQGLSGDITLALADDEDSETYFKVTDSKVNLKNLSLKIHENYHYILSFLFTPLLNAALKISLQHILSGQIADAFEYADWQAFDVRRRAVRYQSRGMQPGQAYLKAMSEPSPHAQTSHPFSGLHSTTKGFIRDDRGPHDAQIAIGGEQLLPGKSGPKSSIDRAAKKANEAAEGVSRDLGLDDKAKKLKKNAPTKGDAQQAGKQADQFKGLVEEEFADAERTADRQRNAEDGDEGWKSSVFDI